MRAAFELTGNERHAYILRDAACERLLPFAEIPCLTLEELNTTSIGYITVIALMDGYLEGS